MDFTKEEKIKITLAAKLIEEQKALADKVEEKKAEVLALLKQKGVSEYELRNGKHFRYIASTTRSTFNSSEFRKKHSELYEAFLKETPVKETLKYQ